MPARKKVGVSPSKPDQNRESHAVRKTVVVGAPGRDPSREPYPSPYTDADRGELSIPASLKELERASAKVGLAKAQKSGWLAAPLYADADASEASATASAGLLTGMVERLARKGEVFDHGRPLGAGDDLTGLMMPIMQERPTITLREMLGALKELGALKDRAGKHHRIIQEVDIEDQSVYFRSKGKEKTVQRRGLQDRMTRIRKILRRQDS